MFVCSQHCKDFNTRQSGYLVYNAPRPYGPQARLNYRTCTASNQPSALSQDLQTHLPEVEHPPRHDLVIDFPPERPSPLWCRQPLPLRLAPISLRPTFQKSQCSRHQAALQKHARVPVLWRLPCCCASLGCCIARRECVDPSEFD